MKRSRNALLAWILFGLIAVMVTASVIFTRVNKPAGGPLSLDTFIIPLVLVTFAFVGALIVSHQPLNVIGWLMMLPGMSLILLTDAYLEPFLSESFVPPESPEPLFLLIVWFSSWNWLLVFWPIIFIMVLFPNGRPFNRRWGWLIYLGLSWAGVWILLSTFSRSISPIGDVGSADWTVHNPIGFLDNDRWFNVIAPVLGFFLLIWILLCAASLFVRFRSSRGVKREQIKWLLFACAVFAVFFLTSLIYSQSSDHETILSILFPLVTLAIPASIGIAILRYRLYDIDIIIRKTLVYGAITLLLGVVYFGSVVLLTQVFRGLTGQDSPVAIVVSTLVIAALFTPLRNRVQDSVDRRFYRSKYDAQQALATFAATARDEVELEQLTEQLLSVVQDTMQPEQTSLWLRTGQKGKNG